MNPKAFISHASEDKKRFVINFSKSLVEKGVDVWLDKWEMKVGDSLVDKIFDEGIKNANVFVIILSKNSIDKSWVKEELNTGFINRIQKKCKIIPVIIDECEVPECLKSILWIKIKNLENFKIELDEIVNSIFNFTEKPKLGNSPEYVNRTFLEFNKNR